MGPGEVYKLAIAVSDSCTHDRLCNTGSLAETGDKRASTWAQETFCIKEKRLWLPSGVGVSLHDDSLDLGNTAMVTRRHDGGGHLCNAQCNGLALGCHQDHLCTPNCMRTLAEPK